ncbi:hypothetical [Yersinia pestis KIM10+]|uniref:Uncharacterized protein n=1 Tax=Yersinia pestis TaxID=632 RepID=Q8CKY1_YERPE|nr:hypothetical [Yersinia pestis KIM10+]
MLLRYFTKKRVFTHFAPLLIDKHRVIRIILRSLPHRQLRKCSTIYFICISGSLPHRQLRKFIKDADKKNLSSLPHRQLRKSTLHSLRGV